MTAPATPEPWMDEAICASVDPELFFPGTGYAGTVQARVAKSVCRGCPVRRPCLDYALREDLYGVWGATTDRDRAKMRRAA